MIDRYINNKINAIWIDQNRFDTWKLIQEKYVETLEELKIAEAGIAKKIRKAEISKEEVYNHRKAKFLKIGRERGFSKSSSSDDAGLSYKGSDIQKIKTHIFKNKLIYIGIGLVFIAGLVSIIY